MNNSFETHTIDNIVSFKELVDYVEENKFLEVVLDVETDSKIERKARLYGIGLCFRDNEAFYIVWRNKEGLNTWSKEQEEEITRWLHSVAQKHKVIGHNLVYDVLVIKYNLNLDLV